MVMLNQFTTNEVTNTITGKGTSIMGMTALGIGAIGGAFKFVKTIPNGERGVVLRWGKAAPISGPKKDEPYKILQPGRHFVLPGVIGFLPVSVLPRPSDLEQIRVRTAQRQKILVNAAISWAVRDDEESMYHSLFRVKDGDKSPDPLIRMTTNICTGGLRKAMNGMPRDWMDDEAVVDQRVKDNCYEELSFYGVELLKVYLQSVNETDTETLVEGIGRHGAELLGRAAGAGIDVSDFGISPVDEPGYLAPHPLYIAGQA